MAIKAIQATQGFQDAQGNALANGTLILRLNQPASATSAGGGQVDVTDIVLALDSSGKITGQPVNLWANDQLTPSTTFYTARVFSSTGLLIFGPVNWTISGTSPVDVSAINP